MKQPIDFVIHHQICWTYSKAVMALVVRLPPARFIFLDGSGGDSCTSSEPLYLSLKKNQDIATMLPLSKIQFELI